MKAGILFTGTGPILILTSHETLDDPLLIEKLNAKGIKKFIACEVPAESAREIYGTHYTVVLNDLHQEDDLRVLDYNGHHIFNNFRFSALGKPIYHDPGS